MLNFTQKHINYNNLSSFSNELVPQHLIIFRRDEPNKIKTKHPLPRSYLLFSAYSCKQIHKHVVSSKPIVIWCHIQCTIHFWWITHVLTISLKSYLFKLNSFKLHRNTKLKNYYFANKLIWKYLFMILQIATKVIRIFYWWKELYGKLIILEV